MRSTTTLALLAGLTAAAPLAAHPGGLDANGCHTNHKTGEYHCHRAPATSPAPQQPTQSKPAAGYFTAQELAAAAKPSSSSGVSIVTQDMVQAAELLLLGMRYQPGTADGKITEETRQAVRAFQRDSGLPEDGNVTGVVLVKLAEAARWKLR